MLVCMTTGNIKENFGVANPSLRNSRFYCPVSSNSQIIKPCLLQMFTNLFCQCSGSIQLHKRCRARLTDESERFSSRSVSYSSAVILYLHVLCISFLFSFPSMCEKPKVEFQLQRRNIIRIRKRVQLLGDIPSHPGKSDNIWPLSQRFLQICKLPRHPGNLLFKE